MWLSLVERYVRDVEVACSNHVTPIFLMNVLESLKIGTPAFFFSVFILQVFCENHVIFGPVLTLVLHLLSINVIMRH